MLPENYVSPRVFAQKLGFERTPGVVLGLSGGADSVSLLNMLLEDGIDVAAVHVNHGIRGEEALRDERFCASLCEKKGVAFFVSHADVPSLAAERGEGLEECARHIRYAVLEDRMKKEGFAFLATAHNADDNAETLLFNLARGASSKGGCGIPEYRSLDYGYVIRPVLGMPKSEILRYCDAHGLEYVTDSTNADTNYSRNRIRANVIPELKKINPDFISSVSGFCETLKEDCLYLDSLAAGFIEANPAPTMAGLSGLPMPVASRVIVALAKRAGACPERIHVQTLLCGVREGRKTAVTLPGGIIAGIGPRTALSFVPDERRKKQRQENKPDGE